jgi:hypothetical protein
MSQHLLVCSVTALAGLVCYIIYWRGLLHHLVAWSVTAPGGLICQRTQASFFLMFLFRSLIIA